jgi:alkylated DNA repair dioxygenase AlkB
VHSLSDTLDLFEPSPPIAGLRYQDDFLSEEEERLLIHEISKVGFKPFRFQQWTGKRLTATFGWRYDFENGTFEPAEPLPAFLLPVRKRAARFASLFEKELEQALLIRYDVGAGIGLAPRSAPVRASRRDLARFARNICISQATRQRL